MNTTHPPDFDDVDGAILIGISRTEGVSTLYVGNRYRLGEQVARSRLQKLRRNGFLSLGDDGLWSLTKRGRDHVESTRPQA